MSKPLELCLYQLPNGQTCRQIRLKGEQLCRHHRRLFRYSEAEATRQDAMEQLAAQLSALDLPDLLYALYEKLIHVRTTVRSHPEAQIALAITFHRLQETLQANTSASQPDPTFHPVQPQ